MNDIGPYVFFDTSKIIISDTTMPIHIPPKCLVGFHGFGCNVKLLIEKIPIDCYDHKISCQLVCSNIYEVEVCMEPHTNVTNWSIIIYFNNQNDTHPNIVDETINEIIAIVMNE